MRNSLTTRFTKAIAIDPEDLKYVEQTKGKKSRAGKLSSIIKFYRENYRSSNEQKKIIKNLSE